MSKSYQTTTPAHDSSRARNEPEDYTLKRMKALGLWTLAALVVLAGWALWDVTGVGAVMLPVVVIAVALITAGAFLWEYSSRAIGRDLPRNAQPKAKRTGDVWRIHLRREIPVADRGTVDMGADVIDLPVKPREFTRIVRDMKRNGTGIDKRPAGVSQPLRTKVLRALEDMDGATNGGAGVGWKLADDIDALLRDIDQW